MGFLNADVFTIIWLSLIGLVYLQHDLIPHLLSAGLLPMLNLLLFIYWLPLLLCLLGARYEDFFQLVPIILQLMFLLTPILYMMEAPGALGLTADCNPLYRVLSNLRHAIIVGGFKLEQVLPLLFCNFAGIDVSP